MQGEEDKFLHPRKAAASHHHTLVDCFVDVRSRNFGLALADPLRKLRVVIFLSGVLVSHKHMMQPKAKTRVRQRSLGF